MARGPKKHMKRLNAPKHWMLDKLGGIYAPKPSSGPHKTRECLPLLLLIRNRLKYALTYREVQHILKSRNVKVDGKVRIDPTFPAGFMDVIEIEKTDECFRMLYDTKGRFIPHPIRKEEASYKLCKVKRKSMGLSKIPYIGTHDGRTIRFPDPEVKVHDSVMIDLETGKVKDFIKFEMGCMCFVHGGKNVGRVGTLKHKERHKGSFDIVHLVDAKGTEFATRMSNVFVIGKAGQPMVSLPKGKGIRLTTIQQQEKRFGYTS